MALHWQTGVGLIAATLIAACASGSGGPAKSPGSSNGPLGAYLNYQLRDDDLVKQYQGLPYTPSADVPGTGQADYSGIMRLLVELSGKQVELLGDLDLTIDFGLASFNGAVTGAVDPQDRGYSGTLVVDGGILDLAADPDTTFRAFSDLVGNLQGQGYDIRINADLYGDFHGSNPVSFSGGVAGQASGTNVGDFAYGSFIAIR